MFITEDSLQNYKTIATKLQMIQTEIIYKR